MARIALTIAGIAAGATAGFFAGPEAGIGVWQAIPGGNLKGASLGKSEKKKSWRKTRESRHSGGHKR